MILNSDSCDRCGAPAPSAFCDRCALVVEASLVGVRTVEIPACDAHHGVLSVQVCVAWFCPVCGGPRGDVYRTLSFDGSLRLHCDGWENACGHVDGYASVRVEATRIPQFARAARS